MTMRWLVGAILVIATFFNFFSLRSVLFSDLFSGLFHWAADNYGSRNTPFFGAVCEAFQVMTGLMMVMVTMVLRAARGREENYNSGRKTQHMKFLGGVSGKEFQRGP